jgi:hypothetical protein
LVKIDIAEEERYDFEVRIHFNGFLMFKDAEGTASVSIETHDYDTALDIFKKIDKSYAEGFVESILNGMCDL